MSDLPPTAFAPIVVEQDPVRCTQCNRMLAELVTSPWRIKCSRCGALNWATADGERYAHNPTKASRALNMHKAEGGD